MPGVSPLAASTIPSDRPNFHFARREIGNDHGESAHQRRGIVSRLDTCKHLTRAQRADIQRQLQQLVGTFNVFRIGDFRDAQIDFGEVVDADGRRCGGGGRCFGISGGCGVQGGGGHCWGFLGEFEQGV